jgi:ribose 5-phosphate isomerase B
MSDTKRNKRQEVDSQVRGVLREVIGAPGDSPGTPGDADLIDESVREVITEAEVRRVPEGGRMLLRDGVIITPLAADLITLREISIHYRQPRSSSNIRRVIAIGADHGGFEIKPKIVELVDQLGFQVRDYGTYTSDPVDYPDIAHAVARAVADKVCDLGILLDGAGIGSCMAANKVPGVRAALCYDESTAKNSREHNYANVLTLGARLQPVQVILGIVTTWLATPHGADRHGRRVAKIEAIERQYRR